MQWDFKLSDFEKVAKIKKKLDLPELILNLLIQRKINDPQLIKDFLSPHYSQFYNPFLMKGMEKAVNRIIENIQKGIPIFILGDYDVDGTSAVSLLSLGILELGGKVVPYIPNRKNDGHGLSKRSLKKAIDTQANLLITCDCGIGDSENIEEANNLGLDVIITDHHLPGELLPNAYAILNPKQKNCTYPFKDLSGSGVAFKLVSGLVAKLKKPKLLWMKLLDIAALGTASDLVPLKSENRAIVYFGLQEMQLNKRPGLQLLLKAGNIRNNEILTVSKINFQIAPLINAVGRLSDANIVVRLLMTNNMNKASTIVNELDKENKKRQIIQKKIMSEALEKVAAYSKKTKLIFLKADNWHPGVIGIIAAKIKTKFKRPTVVITFDQNGNGNGSARSIEGFNIYEILLNVKSSLSSLGGHPLAAGFTLQKDKASLFKDLLMEQVNKTQIKLTKKNILLDGVLKISDINYPFIKLIQSLAPFGSGNPMPKFALKNLEIIGNPIIIGSGSHIRFIVKQNQKSLNVVAFGLADSYADLIIGKPVDISGFPEINIWKGDKTLQFNAQAIRLSI